MSKRRKYKIIKSNPRMGQEPWEVTSRVVQQYEPRTTAAVDRLGRVGLGRTREGCSGGVVGRRGRRGSGRAYHRGLGGSTITGGKRQTTGGQHQEERSTRLASWWAGRVDRWWGRAVVAGGGLGQWWQVVG